MQPHQLELYDKWQSQSHDDQSLSLVKKPPNEQRPLGEQKCKQEFECRTEKALKRFISIH